MLSETLKTKFLEQIGHEFESSNIYLQMSAWCGAHGYEGCERFFRAHSQEEMTHMFRFFDYVNEAGGMSVIPALAKPRADFETLRDVFEATLQHERFITGKINDLAGLAFEERDFSAFNFLQFFVAEQHEEETLFTGILGRFDIVGDDGRGLFLLDGEIGQVHAAAGTGEAAAGGA